MSAIRKFHLYRYEYVFEFFKVRRNTIEILNADNESGRNKLFAWALSDFKSIVMYYLYSPINKTDKIEIYEAAYGFYSSYLKDLTHEALSGVYIGKESKQWYKKYMGYIKNEDMDKFFQAIYKKEKLNFMARRSKTKLRNLMKKIKGNVHNP